MKTKEERKYAIVVSVIAFSLMAYYGGTIIWSAVLTPQAILPVYLHLMLLLILFGAFVYMSKRAFNPPEASLSGNEIFHQCEIGMARIDQKGMILESNTHFDAIFEYAPGETIGREFTSLFREKDRKGLAQQMSAAKSSLGDLSVASTPSKAEGISKSWSRLPVEVKIVPVTAGGFVKFVAMVRDVAIEGRLKMELQRLKSALDQADEAFIIANSEGVVEYINAAAHNLNGGLAAPAKGSMLKANLAVGDNEAENRAMWDSLRIGRSWKSEISRISEGQNRKFEEVFVYPVKDLEGQPGNFLAVRRDITSRKRSEKLISNLSRAIEQSAEMIVVTDASGRIEYVNPSVRNNLGYSEEELIGAKPSLFKSGFHDAEFYKRMWEVLSQGSAWSGRITNKKKSGELIDEELSISPVFGERGEVINFVAVGRDVSGNIARERELILRKEEAESSNRFKDELISIVSHDLKNPIIAALGLVRLLIQDNSNPLSKFQSDILNRVMVSGERAMEMIEKLLLMSPSRLGRWTLNKRYINVYALVDLVFDDLSEVAKAKGIVFDNRLSRNLRFHADYDLFYEVVVNLVSNAIKFSQKGGQIVIDAPAEGKNSIEIKDFGIGIEPERIPNLFRKDVITVTHGTAGEKGYGMGLPFCHEVIAKHGGSIHVQSAPGEGSVFTITLPASKPVVMLVDDDEDFRLMMKELLSGMDVETVEASTGAQALNIIDIKSPCLLITDLFMEPMNGFELMKEIKRRSCPVAKIAITSDIQMDTRQKAFASGAQDFVTKPIQAYDFIPRVKRLLEVEES